MQAHQACKGSLCRRPGRFTALLSLAHVIGRMLPGHVQPGMAKRAMGKRGPHHGHSWIHWMPPQAAFYVQILKQVAPIHQSRFKDMLPNADVYCGHVTSVVSLGSERVPKCTDAGSSCNRNNTAMGFGLHVAKPPSGMPDCSSECAVRLLTKRCLRLSCAVSCEPPAAWAWATLERKAAMVFGQPWRGGQRSTTHRLVFLG